MKDLLAGYVAQLCGLNVMQRVFASSKAVKHVIPGQVARMNDCALIPVASVYLNGVGHSGADQSCAGVKFSTTRLIASCDPIRPMPSPPRKTPPPPNPPLLGYD